MYHMKLQQESCYWPKVLEERGSKKAIPELKTTRKLFFSNMIIQYLYFNTGMSNERSTCHPFL